MQDLLPFIIFCIFCTILIGCVLFLIYGGHRGTAKESNLPEESNLPKASKLPPPPEPERYDVGYKIVRMVNPTTGKTLFAPAWQDVYGCLVFFDNKTAKRIGHITELCNETFFFYRSPNVVLNMLFEHDETAYIGFKKLEYAVTFIEKVEAFEARSYYHEGLSKTD